MKMHFHRMLLLGAIAAFGAANGMAQDLIANIPFHFRTSNAELRAGTYSITRAMTNGAPVLLLTNQETRNSVIVLALATAVEADPRPARMVFQCGDAGCSLEQIWDAADRGYVFRAPRNREKTDRMTMVYLHKRDIKP